MKKLAASILFGVLSGVVSTSAFAASACSGTAGNGTAVPGATDGTLFVQVGFTPKCSSNVLADYEDQTTNFAVASGSSKGKVTFQGSTAGGGVTKSGECPAGGCTTSEIGAALEAAKALAGS